MWAVADGLVDPVLVDELLLIAAVWLSPEADDESAVYANNRQATRDALGSGRQRTPVLDDVLADRDAPLNAYYLRPGTASGVRPCRPAGSRRSPRPRPRG